jgi:hypothetical protein
VPIKTPDVEQLTTNKQNQAKTHASGGSAPRNEMKMTTRSFVAKFVLGCWSVQFNKKTHDFSVL